MQPQLEAGPRAVRREQALAGVRILTLDDDANMRSIIRAALSQSGCSEIHQAGTGDQALKVVAAHPIDLIICDWMMQPMNGFEFLVALRKFEKDAGRTSRVPVIMLTANDATDDAISAQHLGIAAWLVKPIAPKSLLERISSVLALPTQLFSIADDLDVDLTHLARQYQLKLANEISDLKQMTEDLPRQDAARISQHWTAMVRLIHTVKGQAGTFGYDLISMVAAIGLNLLRQAENNAAIQIKFQCEVQRALTVIVGAMSLVLQNDIKGDAGNMGERLLTKINASTMALRLMIEGATRNAKRG
jgi:DNA-binding response OmpR family regulator